MLFVHETNKLFKCEICEKALLSEEGLKDHNAAFHTKLKPYSCEKCGKSFSTNRIYKWYVHTLKSLFEIFSNNKLFDLLYDS